MGYVLSVFAVKNSNLNAYPLFDLLQTIIPTLKACVKTRDFIAHFLTLKDIQKKRYCPKSNNAGKLRGFQPRPDLKAPKTRSHS